MKLAADLMAAFDRALEELEKQFLLYKEKVSIDGKNASPAGVDAAITKVASGNTEIRKKLFDALMMAKGFSGSVIKIDGDPKIR